MSDSSTCYQLISPKGHPITVEVHGFRRGNGQTLFLRAFWGHGQDAIKQKHDGLLMLELNPRNSEIHDVNVTKEHHGIATCLLAVALAVVRKTACRRIRLKSNTLRATGIYTCMGARPLPLCPGGMTHEWDLRLPPMA